MFIQEKVNKIRLREQCLEAMSSQIDEIAREIVSLASKQQAGSKWSLQRIESHLEDWKKSINSLKAPYEVLMFIKRHSCKNREFMMNDNHLSEKLLSLMEESTKGIEDFDESLFIRKKVWSVLVNRVVGYITFAL